MTKHLPAMNHMNNKKMENQILDVIKENMLTSYEYGKISEKDLENRERLWPKIRKAIFEHPVVDYKTSILDQARKYSKIYSVGFARVFYAIYFEHLINRIIHVMGNRKGMSVSSIKNILRNSRIEDKLTWLLELMGIPKINLKHLGNMRSLFEKRNSFVHYKWNTTQLEKMQSRKAWRDEQKAIETTVLYMKKYATKAIFKNKKAVVTKRLSKMNISVKIGRPIEP